eukprot:Unigene4613_Nuclearia_a/m.14085 Unigene4613_Nuclearia_a/g.14085  ORF Unigene4613_Nuclearia_a/g.14085 Unigene4613_Nuclearia_a/m.14085 type:complete len:468 (+) Unigene4613_Nuclearia_a:76-1479(+)
MAPATRAARQLVGLFAHSHGHVACPACAAAAAVGRHLHAQSVSTDYAFEMASSSVRYGPGVTREVGMDLRNLRAQHVLVMTDVVMSKLTPTRVVLEALDAAGVRFTLYDRVRVEPSDASFKEAIALARAHHFDAYVAVGGGSVMDTCKAANLYACYPDADFLDFINAPIGKGRAVDRPLKPLIAVPTTAGTGSETTGTAIFDFKEIKAKTGITSRAIKPHLGVIDPLNARTMPAQVRLASGLDVLCHAIESYTALPYHHRTPRPANPIDRPGYQGSNPISDIWSLQALRMCIEALPRSVLDMDEQANDDMLLAATYAGVGFGNAGVHLCHGLSYPISGNNRAYRHKGYQVDHPLVPHGISVAITAPAVFRATAPADPERHLHVASMFGVDTSRVKAEDAGLILSDALRVFLKKLGVPDGISALGYSAADIPDLVKGALPQQRVLKLSPTAATADALSAILEQSLRNY